MKENRPLLSICVPTYNRTQELRDLSRDFLFRVKDKYKESVEILVSDNSDDDRSEGNRKIFDGRFKYHKNETNLGFAGNVRNCARMASGNYIWILADNDFVKYENFYLIIEALRKNNLDCLFLNYSLNRDGVTERKIKKSFFENRKVDLATLFDSKDCFIPFVFLSSAIVRNNNELLDSLNEMEGNSFYQIYLYCIYVGKSKDIDLLDETIIEYVPELQGRFDALKLFHHMRSILMWICDLWSVDVRDKIGAEYRQLLFNIISDRAGVKRVLNASSSRWNALKLLPENLSFKAMVLALVMYMPISVNQFFYLFNIERVNLIDNESHIIRLISSLRIAYRNVGNKRIFVFA